MATRRFLGLFEIDSDEESPDQVLEQPVDTNKQQNNVQFIRPQNEQENSRGVPQKTTRQDIRHYLRPEPLRQDESQQQPTGGDRNGAPRERRKRGVRSGTVRGPYKKKAARKITPENIVANKGIFRRISEISGHRKRPDLEFRVSLDDLRMWLPASGVKKVKPKLVEQYFDRLPARSKADLLKKHLELFATSDNDALDSDESIEVD